MTGRYADAVVGDWDAGRAAAGEAVLDGAAREHACAAVDDERVRREVVGECVA